MLKIGVTAEMLLNEQITGIEGYILNLSEKLLSSKAHSVRLVLPSNVSKQKYQEKLIFKHDPPFSGLNGPFQSRFISSLINFSKELQEFDLIHIPTVTGPFFFRPPGVKVVMTVHDIIPKMYPEWHPLKRRLYFRYFLPYRFRQVDNMIVVSENTRKDLMRHYNIDSHKIDVVYEGVSNSFRSINQKIKKDFILGVSTLEPRKNFKRLIEAYIQLKEKHNIIEKLYIVGKEGWFFEDFIKIPDKYKNDILFKGYVSNQKLIELYQTAKVFVYPSMYEGFGLPVLEAMACGCPVVTSNVSSLPEVGGSAVLYARPDSMDEIASKIYEVISNQALQTSMSEDGLKQSGKFTWEKCAEETIKVYEKVMKN